MSDLVGKCGRYLWSDDIEPKSWIHNESYDSFTTQHTLGRVYHCINESDGYITIQSNRDESYRVNPEGFDVVKSTSFYIGDTVTVLNGSKAGKCAVICGMGYHLKNQKIIFILNIEGKKSSRQYFEGDFELYNEN